MVVATTAQSTGVTATATAVQYRRAASDASDWNSNRDFLQRESIDRLLQKLDWKYYRTSVEGNEPSQ
eukprot:jgi/Psemu1/56230/gm1.56230_g